MLRPALITVLLVLPLACASTGHKKKQKHAQVQREEGEDEGVDSLTGLLKDFGRSLESKNFDAASQLLRQLEQGVSKASETTKSHPDFEDVAERVERARPRYERAVEDDRIARRNAAIDELIRRGNQLVERGRVILGE